MIKKRYLVKHVFTVESCEKNGNCYFLNCFFTKKTFRKSTKKKVGLDKDRGMAEIHHSTQSRKRREEMEMEKNYDYKKGVGKNHLALKRQGGPHVCVCLHCEPCCEIANNCTAASEQDRVFSLQTRSFPQNCTMDYTSNRVNFNKNDILIT
jgi:hypothetical protein